MRQVLPVRGEHHGRGPAHQGQHPGHARDTGHMALGGERKAQYVFSDHVDKKLIEIRVAKPAAQRVAATGQSA